MSEREWWEPVVTDEEWLAEKRADYPDECAGLDDDDVREKYADGLKYQTLWDNLGDAREEHEALADAYLALRAENERLRTAIEIEREGQRSMARALNEINRLSRLDVAISLAPAPPAADEVREAAERLTRDDAMTLIGHAEYLRRVHGETDMPRFFDGLAKRLLSALAALRGEVKP